MNEKKSPKRSVTWQHFLSAGLELAGIALVFALIGYAIDRASGRQQQPIYAATIGLFGFALAMTRFIIKANRSNREQFHAKPDNSDR